MHDAAVRKVPIVWFRFEDMIMNPEPQLYDMMRLMIGQNDLEGTNAELRIQEVLALGKGATQTYKVDT
jgi:hypothetical protein